MCYTKIVTKKNKKYKRYNIYKEDTKMAVVKLTTDNFEQEVIQAQQPVLVDFYADWCGPCQMLKPVIEQISEEAEHTKIVKINIDEEPQLAGMFQVMSIPTLVYMQNGSIQGSVSGYHSLGQIKSWIGE